jgi:YD repeat-containing protein
MNDFFSRFLSPALRQRLYHAYLKFAPLRVIHRRRLRESIAATLPPWRLLLGRSPFPQPSWIALDTTLFDGTNGKEWATYFKPNHVDAVVAEGVLEYLTPQQGQQLAQHCFAYLKPGGYLRLAVPDGYHPDPSYIQQVRVGSVEQGRERRVLYTYPYLTDMLKAVGFRVTPLEYFDADGRFHAVEWNPAGGKIHRSARFDARNQKRPLSYTSLIVDARKP